MTFTRRTYRVAIRRAVREEMELRKGWHESKTDYGRFWWTTKLNTRIARTARLQRRKRRERK